MTPRLELWVVTCKMQDGTKVIYGPAKHSELFTLYRNLDRHGDALGVVGLGIKTQALHEADERLNEAREIANPNPALQFNIKVGDRDLEFQNGQLVKVDGQRPDYMDGNRLIRLVKEFGAALYNAKL